MPRKSKGDYIFRPGVTTASPHATILPSTSASSFASNPLNLTQLTTATNEIDSIRHTTPGLNPVTPFGVPDPATLLPDIPSTFLTGSTSPSSAITSISRMKRRHTDDAALSSTGSQASGSKRSRPPTAAAKAQQDGADAMSKLSKVLEGFVEQYKETQSSPNAEYARAIKLLEGESAQAGLSPKDQMDISIFLGKNSKDVMLYVNSPANIRALWLQQTLSTIRTTQQ